ncbi:hypothetical protein Q9L58_001322 [Maublancomyces gigas]|uniref:Uncharacterized protein n=1 Tax=Discina gigas TaxID=1032678 RepID=A0ABR3GV71_9PEZI
MSNEFDDFFADSPSISPGESSDKQFLQPVISSGAFHKNETSALKDDTFEWFVDDTCSYQEDSSVEGASAGDDWFFSGSSSGYHGPGTRSVFDDIILPTRNGVARQIMTPLPQLTRTLARMGVSGPRHFKPVNLDSRRRVIGVGNQFTVFVDGYSIKNLEVMKRVNKIFLDPEITAISSNMNSVRISGHWSLGFCHSLIHHRNIVDLIA